MATAKMDLEKLAQSVKSGQYALKTHDSKWKSIFQRYYWEQNGRGLLLFWWCLLIKSF